MADALKQRLYERLLVTNEFNELLGGPSTQGKGFARRCFNKVAHAHQDKTPSLSFDPKTSAYKCHVCGEKGDIFTLYQKVKGMDFPTTFSHLLHKYGLWDEVRDISKPQGTGRTFKNVQDDTVKAKLIQSQMGWASNPSRVEFMFTRYGITRDTMQKYRIGYSTDDYRVWIPIWAKNPWFGEDKGPLNVTSRLPSFVNIRKHDCFRIYASWHNADTNEFSKRKPDWMTTEKIRDQDYAPWQPVYDGGSGKVQSIKGFGQTYLYPLNVMFESPSVYVVGGELKALLLNQLGVPAVAFTAGEGTFSEEFLPYFIGKRVRVLMDVDKKGQESTLSLSQILANHGAYVERGEWPEDIARELPPKGDITDYLRLCEWNPEALSYLKWFPVEAQALNDDARIVGTGFTLGNQEKQWDDMTPVPFLQLIEPGNLTQWVRTNALVAGRGETPFAVPRSATITCEEGKARYKAMCASCKLPKCGFEFKMSLSTEAQIDMVGMNRESIERVLAKETGVPKTCPWPQVAMVNSAVEQVLLTPSVDLQTAGNLSEDDQFQYRTQQAYIVKEERVDIEENKSYELGGRIMPDPKNGKFTFAVRDYRPMDNDILRFKQNPEAWGALRQALGIGRLPDEEIVNRIVAHFRDHVVHIYGQDEMLRTMLLSFFLPFRFRIAQYECERVCPSVMILGDTNVGKSTAMKKMLMHFGAGRYASADSNPTFAGIVGGNLVSSRNLSFSWGLLPTSHRSIVAFDEFGKLNPETIGALTNTLTSGVAERTTVNGNRRTLCHVRLVYLCNPRGARRLTSYSNPLDAALGIMGTVQDLGRVEYVHVQYALNDPSVYNSFHEPTLDPFYSKDLARFHLQWAWSLKPKQYVFEDPSHVFGLATQLSSMFGGHTLLLPAQTRFKLGRMAAAIATLLMSTEGEDVLITRNHVRMAFDLFHQNYYQWINPAQVSVLGDGILPNELMKVFDRIQAWKRLRFLATSDKWSRDDIEDAMGTVQGREFIQVAQFELGLLTRQGMFLKPKHPQFPELIESYLNERERMDAVTSTRNVQK